MSQSETSRTAWEATVSDLLTPFVASVAAARTRLPQCTPLQPAPLPELQPFPGSGAISIEIFKQTPGCREVLLEVWNVTLSTADDFICRTGKFRAQAEVVSRALSVLLQALPQYSNTGDTLHYQILTDGEPRRHWHSQLHPAQVTVFPKQPIELKSIYGKVTVQVKYATVVPEDELAPVPLGPRSRLISIDGAESSDCVRVKTTAISSLAQKCVEVDNHQAGFQPLGHSMTMFEEQSTFASECEDSLDLDFCEENRTEYRSESAEIAVFLDTCEHSRDSALFNARAAGTVSQAFILESILRDVRTLRRTVA